MIKRINVILVFLCAALIGKADGPNHTFIPTPGEIAIIASTPIPDGVEPTRQAYLDLIACGFNAGMTNGGIDFFKKQFRLIGDLDFKYLIQNDDLFSDKRKELVAAFKDEPNFGGWKFKDEPHFNTLRELKQQYQALYDADPHNLIYINFAGVVNKYFCGSFTTFPEYLDYVEKLIGPEIWSFDYYPIITRNGKTICESEPFYYALESFSEISRKTSRPFWSYCESMQYTAESYSRPAATEAYLRFQVFSALAYGAQGILYWTYGQRTSNAQETYISALVNMNGKKTPTWYAAAKVNGEIKKYKEIFYGCKVLDVRHTGDRLYRGTRKLTGDFGPLQMVRSGEAGVMVSRLENNGAEYIVIVNRDVFNKQAVTLELKPNINLLDVTSTKNKIYSWRKDVKFTLNKGGYIILKVS